MTKAIEKWLGQDIWLLVAFAAGCFGHSWMPFVCVLLVLLVVHVEEHS